MVTQEFIGTQVQRDRVGQDLGFWKKGSYSDSEFIRAVTLPRQRVSAPLDCNHNGIKPIPASLETNIVGQVFFVCPSLEVFAYLRDGKNLEAFPMRAHDLRQVAKGRLTLGEFDLDVKNLLAVCSYKIPATQNP